MADLSDGVAGGDCGEPPSARKRKAASKRAAGGSRDACGDDDVCHLCEQPLPADDIKLCMGYDMHNKCKNAVRCHRRLLAKNPDALRRADEALVHDPESWRGEVLPLIKEDGRRRSSAARRVVRQSVKETSQVEESGDLEQALVLNKRRFKSYHKFWDGWTSGEASENFDDTLELQGRAYCTEDEDKVKVDDNLVITKFKGKRSANIEREEQVTCDRGRSRSRRRSGVGSDPAAPHNRRLGDHGRQQGHQDARGGARGRHSTRSERGCKSADSDELEGLGGSNSEGDTGSLSSLVVGGRRGSGAVGRSSALSSRSSASGAVAARDGNKRVSPVAFMQDKVKLKNDIQKELSTLSGPKSLKSKLVAAKPKLTANDINSLEKTPDDILAVIDGCKADYLRIQSDLETARSATMEGLKTRFADLRQEVLEKMDLASEQFEAVEFVLQEKQRQVKAEKNAHRYQKTKVQNRLVAGGFGKVMAKQVSLMQPKDEIPNTSVDDLKYEEVHMWDNTCKHAPVVALMKLGSKQVVVEAINQKKDILLKSLAENERWGGAMTVVDLPSDMIEGFGKIAVSEFARESGSEAWLCCQRPYQWRYGPNCFPLIGLPAIVWNIGSHDLNFVFLPMAGVLCHGIALKDLSSFLETPTGAKFVDEMAIHIALSPGNLMWSPTGFIAIPIGMLPDDDKDEKTDKGEAKGDVDSSEKRPELDKKQDKLDKKKFKDSECSVFLVNTVLTPSKLATVEGTVWTALLAWNSEHLRKVRSQRVWAPRASLFEKFAQSVADFKAKSSSSS